MNDVEIREYDPQDRDDCINLLKATFPGTSDENTFAWRFESPRSVDPLLICAKHQGKIKSINSWIPWEFNYNNKLYLGYQSGESATKSDYRGKGLFTRILSYADEIAKQRGVDFLFGFPSTMSYGPLTRAGYLPIATNYFSIRLLNPLMRVNANNEYIKYTSSLAHNMLTEDNRITPVVNEAYCNWRYRDNPKHYDTIEYIENNSKLLFHIRRNTWKCLPELILLDCQLSNYNDMFIKHALDHINSTFLRKALYIRTFFSQNTDRGRMLSKYFPLLVKSKYCILIIKNLSNRIHSTILNNYNNWDIMPHLVDDL